MRLPTLFRHLFRRRSGLLLCCGLAAGAVLPAQETPAAESISALQQRAAAGNASAQYYLGLRYSHGVDVARDDRIAADWYAKAALQGDAAAQTSLAPLLRDGTGLPKDPGAARAWLRMLAARVPAAAAKLGELLLYGEGGAVETDTALRFLRQAAAQGDPSGQFLLAQALEQGLGARSGPDEPKQWLERAAAAHDPRAQHQLALRLLEGEPDAETLQRAVRLLQEAAAQALPAAQHALARLLEDGRGLPADAPRAAELFREAARAGFAPAQASLGRMLVLGRGVPRDPAEAVRWLTEAAGHDEPAAHFNLGLLAEAGVGVPRDAAAAAASHLKAAKLGFGPAELRYAQLLQEGRGVKADAAEAAAWAALASDHGASGAAEFLAKFSPEERLSARRRALELRAPPARPAPPAVAVRAPPKEPASSKAQLPRLTGTAFGVRADGLAVTSFKLLEGAKDVRVVVANVPRPARLLAGEERTDLALLQIDGAVLPVFTLTATTLQLGHEGAAVGLHDQVARSGEVLWMPVQVVLAARTGEGPLVGLDRFWPASAAGGPLLDPAGRVLGVLTQVADRTVAPRGDGTASAFSNDMGYVAPVAELLRFAREQGCVLAVQSGDNAAGPGVSREAVAASLLPVLVF